MLNHDTAHRTHAVGVMVLMIYAAAFGCAAGMLLDKFMRLLGW